MLVAGIGLAGCQTSTVDTSWPRPSTPLRAVHENIASLTEVINANPPDREAYNVRGSAFGRAGRYQEALKDFDQAIALNPRFFRPMPTAR